MATTAVKNYWSGPISAPDDATLKEESHALQRTTASPYNATPTDLLRADLRDDDHASLQALTPAWEERFLKTSTSFSTLEAYVCQIADSPRGRIQKAATTIFVTRSKNATFLCQLPNGPPKFWDQSVEIMWRRIRNAARASRPGLAVGALRVLCNGMCTTEHFHAEDAEHSCMIPR